MKSFNNIKNTNDVADFVQLFAKFTQLKEYIENRNKSLSDSYFDINYEN